MVNGFVAVARTDDGGAAGTDDSGPDGGQNAAGGAVDQIPGSLCPPQGGGAGHGIGQNAVCIVQVIYAGNFGHIPPGGQARCRHHPPLVPRHVQGVKPGGSIGLELRLEKMVHKLGGRK